MADQTSVYLRWILWADCSQISQWIRLWGRAKDKSDSYLFFLKGSGMHLRFSSLKSSGISLKRKSVKWQTPRCWCRLSSHDSTGFPYQGPIETKIDKSWEFTWYFAIFYPQRTHLRVRGNSCRDLILVRFAHFEAIVSSNFGVLVVRVLEMVWKCECVVWLGYQLTVVSLVCIMITILWCKTDVLCRR